MPGRLSIGRQGLRAALVVIAGASALLSLAQPRWGFEWSEVRSSGADIVIAVDVSKSMDAQDVSPSRLGVVKRKIQDLLKLMRGDRVGLVVFAGTAFVQCPLTIDYDAVMLFLDLLDSELIPVGGSALAEAVDISVRSLSEGGLSSSRGKAIILMSDGEDMGGELEAAIDLAVEKGVKVFALGIGTPSGGPIPLREGGFKKDQSGNMVLTRLQTAPLQQLAEKTGGAFALATPGDEDLMAVYATPLRGQGGGGTASEDRQKIWHERFQWLLFPALLLLLVEAVIAPLARRRTRNTAAKAAVVLILLSGAWSGGWDRDLTAQAQTPRAAEDRPDIAEYNLGVEQYRSGDFETAAKHFGAAAQSTDESIRGKALFNLGNTRARLGQYRDAAAAYDEVLSIDPENQKARENRDYVRQLKEPEKPPKSNDSQDSKQNDQSDQASSSPSPGPENQPHASPNAGSNNAGSPKPEPSAAQSPRPGASPEDNQGDSPQSQPSTGAASPVAPPEQKMATDGSPSPAASGTAAPELVEGPSSSPAADGGESGAAAMPGQISKQQAEQLLRGIDDKISRFMYRPEGAKPPEKPRNQPSKDW
jgi:Ca-activated chloride channel family protein